MRVFSELLHKMGNIPSSLTSTTVSTRSSVDSNKSYEDDSFRMESLHGNLMRNQVKRDPMKIFEIIEVLGEGSMGSVSRCRKRDSAMGGSAREAFVKSQKGCCFQLLGFCPAFGSNKSKFVSGWDDPRISDHLSSDDSSRMSSVHGSNRDVYKKSSSMISYGTKKDVYYALKSIHLDRCSSEEFKKELKNEVEILKNLDHPNIVRAIETFNYRDRLFLVLELCSGGDLYSRDPYSESAAQNIVQSLVSAISYLHSKGIVHRDLKFENIMFVSQRSDEIKLIDFGLSQKFAADEHLHDAVGTVYTMAPELIAGDYDSKADCWSIGVIAFMLLSSSMPFYGKDRVQVIKKIVKGRYHFSSRRWKHVSDSAKQFVASLLQRDLHERPTSEEALKSNWLTHIMDPRGGITEIDTMDNVQATMQAFAGYGKLKKLALMVIAYKSTTEEIGFLRNMFNKFDKEKNGEISLEEFKEALSEQYDYTEEEAENLFKGVDVDGTGKVHYMEFLAATMEAHGSIDEERLAEAFDRIDCDDSGYITVANLQEFLGDDIPDEYLDEVIDEADITGDHRISYDEFLALWDDSVDEKMKESKLDVRAKRISRQSSMVSSISSADDIASSVTDSDRSGLGDLPSSSKVGTGTLLFNKQKEQSVRGLWV